LNHTTRSSAAPEEHEELRAHIADQIFLDGNQAQAPSGSGRILGGVLAAQLRRKGIEARLRLRNREARLQAAQSSREQPHRPQHGNGKGRRHVACGRPHIHLIREGAAGVPETRRHHANYRIEIAVHADILADHLRVGSKGAPPEAIADHHS
jgi:hypothetical protein